MTTEETYTAWRCMECGRDFESVAVPRGERCVDCRERYPIAEVDSIDPESLEAAADTYDRLAAGTFYDDVPASFMLDPNTHPRGPEYVPEEWPNMYFYSLGRELPARIEECPGCDGLFTTLEVSPGMYVGQCATCSADVTFA